MSAQWSLTYLKTDASIEKVFDVIVASFHSQLEGKLYDSRYEGDSHIDTKLEHTIVEKFTQIKRAKMIVDSHIVEHLNRGVILYPKVNGLYTLVDSIYYGPDVYCSGRQRRIEIANLIREKHFLGMDVVFLFMDFLKNMTKSLDTQAAHIMFDRNPAARATGVHIYENGQFMDDYYFEDIDGSNLVELPQKLEFLQTFMEGKFSFLRNQPGEVEDDGVKHEVYFDGEDLSTSVKDPQWDVFNVRASNLYVPFWDDSSMPFGAIYCPNQELPAYFVERYGDS